MEKQVILGFVSGLLLGWGNLRLIKYLVPKMLQENGSRGHAVRFGSKIICLIGIVGFLMLVVKVNPVAFMVGFSVVIPPLLIKGVFHA